MNFMINIVKDDKLTDIRKIEILSKHFESIGQEDYEIFVKALFMYIRQIKDEDKLNEMYEIYESNDISIIHDAILDNY